MSTPIDSLWLLPALLTTVVLGRQEPGATRVPLEAGAVIALPGVEGRIDHLALDAARERLYVAALGNDTVEVVDLKLGKRVRSLHGVREPQGILYLADSDRVVVASGQGGSCEVFDGDSLELVESVAVGADADNLRYDPRRERVYVAYGDGALGIVDAASWKLVGSVALAGHPESFQLDAAGERAFVNVPGAHQVALVDLKAGALLDSWTIEEAAANYPMALIAPAKGSEPRGLLLLGCRTPARLVLRALPSGERVGALELSGDVDDLFHDAPRRRLYAACGAGFLDVFEEGPQGWRPATRFATAAGARTCLFVPERDQLFVAVPHRGEQGAEIRTLLVRD